MQRPRMRNTPPDDYVLVAEADEVEFIAECLRRAGARDEEARTCRRTSGHPSRMAARLGYG